MRARTQGAGLLAALLMTSLGLGCERVVPLDWSIVVPDGLQSQTIVARIRRDGCGTDDRVIYTQRLQPRAEMDARLPELEDDDFCFDVEAQDANCAVIARSLQTVTFPLAAGVEPRIVSPLEPITPEPCAVCSRDGCVMCDDDETACGEPTTVGRCCPGAIPDACGEDVAITCDEAP